MKTNIKSSRVMKMAHLLKRQSDKVQGTKVSWSQLVKHAWYFEHFRSWLHEGLVTFTFLKMDNSIRDARGTLCEHLIPQGDRPKGLKDIKINYSVIKYYDIDRKAWREFDIRRFVGYVERYPIVKER